MIWLHFSPVQSNDAKRCAVVALNARDISKRVKIWFQPRKMETELDYADAQQEKHPVPFLDAVGAATAFL